MAKKVLIISSSPRKGGNSDLLCDEFMKGAIEAGNEVEKIFLKDKTVHPCTGCSVCSMYGKPCPQKDDAAEIVEKMIAADVIVMATPVYFYTMCGQMKIMIDRCCARYTEITNKDFYFIIAAAENDKAMMERTIDGFRGFLADFLQHGIQPLGVKLRHIGAIRVGKFAAFQRFRKAAQNLAHFSPPS